MPRRCLLVSSFVVFLLSSTRANADVVNVYQFSGDNGLIGSFTLDTSVGFTITGSTDGVVTSAMSTSPLNQLTGSLGPFTFGGGDRVDTVDTSDPFALFEFSMWILRAGAPVLPPISSNTVGGRTVTGVNLFLNYNACCIPPTFTPSFPTGAFFATQYDVTYSDGTTDSGALQTLQLVGTTTVPEPTSLVLLAISLAGIWMACSKFFPRLLGVFKRLEKRKERTYPPMRQPIPSDVLRALRMMRRHPTKFPRSSPISSTEVPVEGHPRGLKIRIDD